ncbi:CAP domain-containing protein [Flavobacterium jejuense]|uniref:CAP domain-containing protein n=1 Tax=Flavobacterium jejuense TaxID=1544455 RepID=A0ABX0IT45_9FLAO|nr:CAP domain-containing protein [Flavobacterium jejuense]NHN26721.1 CAP domain-containing protein [Flavobacterium jejuense]
MNKKIVILFALLLTITLLTACSSNTENLDSNEIETSKNYSHSPSELELLDMVNAYRVENGLNALEIIEHISFKGGEHNDYMIATQQVNHDGFSQRKSNFEIVLGAVKVGENVAYGYATTQAAMNAWINSQEHKAVILGDYTHFGISVKTDSNNKKYYTNMYIKK